MEIRLVEVIMNRRDRTNLSNGGGAEVVAAWGLFVAALLCVFLVPLAL
jgi:hypothetical protein